MNTIEQILKLSIIWKKVKCKYLPRLLKDSDFPDILRSQGISVGKGTVFFNPKSIDIDRSRPYLLHIGEYCKITSGVVILTHDYSRSVMRRVYGEIIGEGAETHIGDNVFIGMNTVILMGSKIGNNVIIGAGSIVNGQIPDNCVAAGNPCRIVRTLKEQYEKRKREEIIEAGICMRAFYKKYNRLPTVKETEPFWELYLDRDMSEIERHRVLTKLKGDSEQNVIDAFLCSQKTYES